MRQPLERHSSRPLKRISPALQKVKLRCGPRVCRSFSSVAAGTENHTPSVIPDLSGQHDPDRFLQRGASISLNSMLYEESGWYRWLGSLSPSLAVFVTFSILPGVVCITIRITIGNTISAADIPPATRTDAPCIAYEAAQFLQKQEHSCIAQVKYRRHWTTNSFSHFPGCQNAPGFLMLERMGRTMYRCHNGTLDFGTELLTNPTRSTSWPRRSERCSIESNDWPEAMYSSGLPISHCRHGGAV